MTDTPARDHNQPPELIQKTIHEELAERYDYLTKRIAELTKDAATVPAEITTEEQFKPVSDLIKAARAIYSPTGAMEAARKIENEEARKRVAQIDAFFKNPAEALKKLMAPVIEKATAYLDNKKAEEEKRRKDEADRKAKIAADKAEDAIWADARGELAAYDARKADERAVVERARKEAAARRADHLKDRGKRLAKAEPYLQKRAERRRLALEAEAQRRAKAAADEIERLTAEGEHRLALEAEDVRRAEDAARLEAARVANQAKLDQARKDTAAARRAETKAAGQAEALDQQAEEHADDAEDLEGQAGRLAKRASSAQRRAEASPADMSRERSEMGTVSSIAKSWKVTGINRDELDLDLLRGYLHPDAVEVAVRAYMMAHRNDAGGPTLKGATFEQIEDGVFR